MTIPRDLGAGTLVLDCASTGHISKSESGHLAHHRATCTFIDLQRLSGSWAFNIGQNYVCFPPSPPLKRYFKIMNHTISSRH